MPGRGDSDHGTKAMTVDATGNVYVVGMVHNTLSSNALTVKYNTSGVEQWRALTDGSINVFGAGYAVAVDRQRQRSSRRRHRGYLTITT